MNFTFGNWKLYAFGLVSIIAAVAILLAIHFYKLSAQPGLVLAAQKVLKDPAVPLLDTFRDKHGVQHAEIAANTNQVSRAALKDTAVKSDSIIKKVAADLNGISPDRFLEVTQENLQLKASVMKLTKDIKNLALLAYKDSAVSFAYDPRDSTLRNLLVNLRINEVKYSKRKFLSETPVYDFYANDPRVTFSGFTHFSVAVPPPLFGLTADVRAAYLISTGAIVPSVGVNARLGKWYLEGRSYIAPRSLKAQQLISFGYKQTLF